MNYTALMMNHQDKVESRANGLTADECMGKKRFYDRRYAKTFGTTDGSKHSTLAQLWFSQALKKGYE